MHLRGQHNLTCSRGKSVHQPAPGLGDWPRLAFSPEQPSYGNTHGRKNQHYRRFASSEKSMYSLDFLENRCTFVVEAGMITLTPGRVQNLDPLTFWGVPSGPSTWGGSKWPKGIQLKMIGFTKMQS